MGQRDGFARAAPGVFVLLWATGFMVARLVAPHADPLTFLVVRFGLSAAVFAAIAVVSGARWPRSLNAWRNLVVVGVLMQGIYLGGVFWSVHHGLPAGISALVTGLQPLLTAMLSFWLLGERVRARRWCGIGVGFAGVLMVLAPQLARAGGAGLWPLLACGVSTLATTLGTIWQKRTGATVDLRVSGAVQFGAAAAVLAPFALLLEAGRFDGSWQVLAGLAWGIVGLSLGAVTLLLVLLRRGAVAGVASLMYMVPPVAAGLGYWCFGDTLNALQMAGMAVAAIGVWVASHD